MTFPSSTLRADKNFDWFSRPSQAQGRVLRSSSQCFYLTNGKRKVDEIRQNQNALFLAQSTTGKYHVTNAFCDGENKGMVARVRHELIVELSAA